MEEKILNEYEKIKDKISKEEFLAEIESFRDDFPQAFTDLDLAQHVVNKYVDVEEVSSEYNPNKEIVMNDFLKGKYDEIKDFISEDEFLKKMNELRIENKDVSFQNEESFADQIIGEFVTQENELISAKDEYSTDTIKSLEDGDTDKSIVGRVMIISNPKSFKTRKGNSGKVCNVEIADNTGKIRVVLWTENIKHLKDINEGDIVRVAGVDIKDGYSGLEATMRPRSVFEKADDVNPDDFPSYSEEITNIADIKADTTVNVIARITRIPSIRTYNKNGKEGKVGSIEIQDATGSISYTLWNNNVDLIESLDLNDGDTVKILQAQVRSRNDELSLSHWDGRIIKGDFEVPEFTPEFLKIGDLDDGDRDVALIGIVSKIQDIRKFIRKSDKSEGQLRNFDLTDDTGSMRITLWGDNADLDINKGDIIKLIGGNVNYDEYTSNGHSINTNFSTQITINPTNLTEEQEELFNNIKAGFGPTSLEEVKTTCDEDGMEFDVIGRVMSVGDVRVFERASDGSEGRVRSVMFSDGTEVIQLSLWDGKTELEFKPGEAYQIENARAKIGMEDVGLNIGSTSRVIHLSEEEAKFLPSFKTLEDMIYEYREISDLDEYDTNIYVVGRIFEVFDIRELERDDGSKNLLRNIEIADNSQAIRVSVWGETAKREFEVGEPIKIQNPGISFYEDHLNLSISGTTAIVKPSDDELMNLPSYEELKEAIYIPKDIEAIEDGDVNVRVTGSLTDLRDDRLLIRKCPQCGANVNETYEDENICDECGAVFDKPRTNIMLPAVLVDDTGEIDVTFFGELVEELLEMPQDDIVEIISDDPGALEGKVEDLNGLNIEIIANVRFNEYSESRVLAPKKILQKYY